MDGKKSKVAPNEGPMPAGPYSPALISGDWVYISGQVGRDPLNGQLAGRTIEAQTRQTLENIGILLHESGCDFEDVIKTTVFLAKADFFPALNAVYQEFFPEPFPARSTVVCTLVEEDFLVEIDAIAKLPEAN